LDSKVAHYTLLEPLDVLKLVVLVVVVAAEAVVFVVVVSRSCQQ
jgi:hypothetical protein